jgi:hypothetical protein
MTLPEITQKWTELDTEYDALTEKLQAKRHELMDKHGYSYDEAAAMMSSVGRKEFDRQTEIEAELKALDTQAQTIMATYR